MQLVQSTWIRPTTNVSERRRAGNIVTMRRRFENVVVASSPKLKKVQINWITWKVSRHNIVIIHDWERMLNCHPRFLEIHYRRGGRLRGRKSHLTRSLVASEGWSLVRDRTNRKQCLSHKIWSYKRDGHWWGWSFDRGSTVYTHDLGLFVFVCVMTSPIPNSFPCMISIISTRIFNSYPLPNRNHACHLHSHHQLN